MSRQLAGVRTRLIAEASECGPLSMYMRVIIIRTTGGGTPCAEDGRGTSGAFGPCKCTAWQQ